MAEIFWAVCRLECSQWARARHNKHENQFLQRAIFPPPVTEIESVWILFLIVLSLSKYDLVLWQASLLNIGREPVVVVKCGQWGVNNNRFPFLYKPKFQCWSPEYSHTFQVFLFDQKCRKVLNNVKSAQKWQKVTHHTPPAQTKFERYLGLVFLFLFIWAAWIEISVKHCEE